MRKTYGLIFLIISTFITCCHKDDSELRLSEFKEPVIDGYYIRDDNGSCLGTIGSPNSKLGNGSDYNHSTYYFTFYPNPSLEGFCYFNFKTSGKQELKKLIITKVSDSSSSRLNINNINTIYVGGYPVLQAEFTLDQFTIDLSSLENGYYRIYVKVNKYLFYDNLMVYKISK